MAVTDDFRDFVIGQLVSAGRVTSRRMFGGVGLYLDGLFFALMDDDVLYFKTDDETRKRYQQAGTRPFCPYPDRPDQSMGYWEVPAEVLEDPDELAPWARQAMRVALAAQSARRKRKPMPKSRRRR